MSGRMRICIQLGIKKIEYRLILYTSSICLYVGYPRSRFYPDYSLIFVRVENLRHVAKYSNATFFTLLITFKDIITMNFYSE